MSMQSGIQGETAVVFNCHGSRLIGVLHHTVEAADTGLLTIVAGGPQYRGGCGRQLVELGRRLAQEGIPVFRFDYRGMGDSEGEFLGFRYIEKDIQAAIDEFKRNVPSLRRIILWGGCDAASAVLIHAYRFDDVVGVIAANPFISSDEITSSVKRRHYMERNLQHSSWPAILGFKYDVKAFLRNAIDKLSTGKNLLRRRVSIDVRAGTNSIRHVDEMLSGLSQFKGRVLFLMSGRSLISKEFDELVQSNAGWKKTCESAYCERHKIPEGDQTFSTRESRDAMLDSVSGWAKGLAFTVTN